MKLVNGRILGLLNCEMFSVGKIAVAIHGFFPGIEKQRLPTILYNNHWQMIPPKKEVFILYPNAIVDFFMWVSNLFICVTMTLEWCSQFVPLKQVLWLVEIDAFIGGGGGGRQQSHSGKLILLFLSQDVTLVWEVICQVRLFSHEEPLPLQAARGSAAVAAREPPTHLPVSKVCCFFCWFSVWPRWKSCPYGKLTIASLWKVTTIVSGGWWCWLPRVNFSLEHRLIFWEHSSNSMSSGHSTASFGFCACCCIIRSSSTNCCLPRSGCCSLLIQDTILSSISSAEPASTMVSPKKSSSWLTSPEKQTGRKVSSKIGAGDTMAVSTGLIVSVGEEQIRDKFDLDFEDDVTKKEGEYEEEHRN